MTKRKTGTLVRLGSARSAINLVYWTSGPTLYLSVPAVHGSLTKDGNQVRQTEGEFSFHCEGRNVHVHHVTINNYVIHGSESSPRQSPDEEQESKHKGQFQIFS